MERYIRGRTTLKLQTVVQHTVPFDLVISHHTKSNHDDRQRDSKTERFLAEEIDRLSLFPFLCIEFLIPDSHCIEGVYNHPCNYQSRKHRYDDTERQCLCKSTNCTGTTEPKYCSRNQCRNITVHNG